MIYAYCLGTIVVGAVLLIGLHGMTGGVFGGALIGHAVVIAAMKTGRDLSRR